MRTLFSKLALTAALMLAITFTFSCSGDSGGGNGNGEQSNISSGTEANAETSSSSKGTGKSSSSNEAEGNSSSSIAGGKSSSNGNTQSSSSQISIVERGKIIGVSQKGPFAKGSAITLSELNDKLAQTGRSFEATINDDKGSFEIGIKDIELASPYVMLKANGYYRNEISGEISKAPINLYAIADIREKSNINVNILTHLEYNRVQKLVENGKSLKDAKKQAQKEILAVFGITGEFKDSEDMSIFGTSDGDAALLAISVLLQGELSEGQFVERLADFNLGFKETGAWDNKTAKDAMANWAAGQIQGGGSDYCEYTPTSEYPINCWPMPTDDMCEYGRLVKTCSNPNIGKTPTTPQDFAKIRNNILGWNLSPSVPDFGKFLNNYWYVNYGLGTCDASSQNSIKSSNKKVDYICKNSAWVVATEYERDTYKWGACSKEGEIKEGQASNKKYICKDKAWALASEAEIQLGLCTKEGEVKSSGTGAKGEKTYYYICRSKSWEWASESDYDIYALGACTKEGEIKAGQASGQKYICKSKSWETPSEYELDVGGLGSCSTAGEIKKGNVSNVKYICKNKTWSEARYIDIKCSEKSCLTFTDARDKQSYYSVKIGTQTWMAENLNYNANGSKCYDDKPANCDLYGRLYNWETAKKSCPTGWHLPSIDEWDKLVDLAGGNETAGHKLKTADGWNDYGDYKYNGNGGDDYGFSALPGGGSGFPPDTGYPVGMFGLWWSSSAYNADNAYYLQMYHEDGKIYWFNYEKFVLLSVRCVQN